MFIDMNIFIKIKVELVILVIRVCSLLFINNREWHVLLSSKFLKLV